MPYVSVLSLSELPPGTARRCTAGSVEVAIYNVDGEVFATADLCSHAHAHLSEGSLEGHTIQCPKHGGRFDVRTGKATRFPAFAPVRTYDVRVEGSEIQVMVDVVD